MDHAYKTFLR